jgi:hypothetical protein
MRPIQIYMTPGVLRYVSELGVVSSTHGRSCVLCNLCGQLAGETLQSLPDVAYHLARAGRMAHRLGADQPVLLKYVS